MLFQVGGLIAGWKNEIKANSFQFHLKLSVRPEQYQSNKWVISEIMTQSYKCWQ